MIRVDAGRFVDEHGRTLHLRGVNLAGSSKLPRDGDSFLGRPFHLAEADAHFERLRRWGLTTIRLLTTWEAVEHAGPRQYDLAYLDFLEALLERAGRFELDVFLDFHQDVWSRFTGGDGAPAWTLELAGFDVDALHETGAAFLEAKHTGPLPRMIWPTNAGKLGSATMFTLFFGGDTFAPRRRIEGGSAQRFLQEHFFGAVEQVVRRAARFPHVFGVDLLNEPSPGYIGWEDLTKPGGPVEVGLMPSPLDSMALGLGRRREVKRWHRGVFGPRVIGREVMNPRGRRAWRADVDCVWREHGVWADEATPRLLAPDHFRRGSFEHDFLEPFHLEGARRIHALAPRLVTLVHGEPLSPVARTPWKGATPAAWSPHWYDGYVLFMKDFRSFIGVDAFTQSPVFGAGRIRKSYAAQLARLADEAKQRALPLLVGELGIAFDLRGGHDERLQIAAMNRTLTAVEDAGVSATLWNYSPDNTHARGDGWNGEDLSLFSLDAPPGNDGGRALQAVVRPRPLALAGRLKKYGFDLRTRRFELELDVDPHVRAPSELFVPQLQYPRGVTTRVSAGRVELDLQRQRLAWHHEQPGVQRLTFAPAESSA
ncbi:MAG: cytoplasm protein [Myxococcota bacterium]